MPENRDRTGGRLLSLRFVIVPGRSPAPADPLVYIAGGPGESAVLALPLVLATLRSVDTGRELIFLEQRGTGGSSALNCPGGMDLVTGPSDVAALRRCFAQLHARADLKKYSSLDAVADLEDLRAALGYRRMNLVGVSYGVRVALLYMREHPRQVRTAVLRAAYPVDYNIIAEGTAAADRALAQVLGDCNREPACRQAFPQLRDQLRLVDDRLASAPARVNAAGPDGRPTELPVTREFVHQLLVVMMQSVTSRQYIPLLVSTAASNGFQPFATQISELRTALSDYPVGMYLSVLCAEDAPRPQQGVAAPLTPLYATGAKLRAVCSAWSLGPAPARTLAPFTSDVPTLLISGTLDPVTPAEAASRLAASLRRATHLIVPATAHGPMFPDCTRPTVAAFIRTAAGRPLGTACGTLSVPRFALPASAASATPAGPGQAQPAIGLQGTWDLQWKTRRGPSPGGYLVISQNGTRLDVELHGRGSVRASGTLEGNRFILRGSRFFVPYTLTGTLSGDSMEGVLKISSIEKQFMGRRRIVPPVRAPSP